MQQITMRVDVTDAAGIGEALEMVCTVCLPDSGVTDDSVVCFAWPGGGYNRRYFTFTMPGDAEGGEAAWHVDRGWIFVAIDSLNTGESSHPADGGKLSFEVLAAANDHVVRVIREKLAQGEIVDGLQRVTNPFTIGLGQSLGGSLVVLTQGQRATFDAIAVLGFSGRHTKIWAPPELVTGRPTYIPRGTNLATLTEDVFVAAMPEMAFDADGLPLCAPGFHMPDVPRDLFLADMIDYPARRGQQPEWGSATIPPCAMTMMSPGAISPEAARIGSPIFIGVGQLDTVPKPHEEPTAYPNSNDITVFVCADMAHMHNFASTRERMWTRFHGWAETSVQTSRAARHGLAAPKA